MLLFKFLTFLNLIFLINSLNLSKRESLTNESVAEAEIKSRSESVSNIENGLKSENIGDLEDSPAVRRMLKSVKDKCASVIARLGREDYSTEKLDAPIFSECTKPMLDFASKNKDNELTHLILYDCTNFSFKDKENLCADQQQPKLNASLDFITEVCTEYFKKFATFSNSTQQELGGRICKKVCGNLSNKFTSDLNCTCFKGEAEEKGNSFTFSIGKSFSFCANSKEIDQILNDNNDPRFFKKSRNKDKRKRFSTTSKPITV